MEKGLILDKYFTIYKPVEEEFINTKKEDFKESKPLVKYGTPIVEDTTVTPIKEESDSTTSFLRELQQPIPIIEEIEPDLIHIDIEDLLRSEGITSINGKKIHFGSREVRPSDASYGATNSWHKQLDRFTGNASARDISIIGGTTKDYEDFKNVLLQNSRVREYMKQKQWGILNEITPEMLSRTKGTGNHFHFGPDKSAVRTWNRWLANPNTLVTAII